jgi:hypothetical protein
MVLAEDSLGFAHIMAAALQVSVGFCPNVELLLLLALSYQ